MSKELKILIIAPTLDTFLGGQAIQADRLARKLNEVPGVRAELQSIGPVPFPALQKVKYLRTALSEAKYLLDISRRIRRFDIIHMCSAANWSFLMQPTPAVLVARAFGKKTILNYRSGQLDQHYERWGRSLTNTLRLFDEIVTPSEYLVGGFADIGFEARAIYNFIDVEKFTFRVRKPLKPVFFSNRLLEELYNIPCILRAFRIVQDRIPEARLIVASFGDQREFLENFAAELKLENVKFVGKVDQQRMAELYNEVDIYLNSPNTDNMPGSILECYASGVPIVTTRAGGIPYILEHEKTGLMVDINDHQGMADAALRLLADADLVERLVANGRQAVRKYSWETVGEQWLELYASLVDAPAISAIATDPR